MGLSFRDATCLAFDFQGVLVKPLSRLQDTHLGGVWGLTDVLFLPNFGSMSIT